MESKIKIAKQMRIYDKHAHFFRKNKFDREIAERIAIAAKGGGVGMWDMYYIFHHARWIPPGGMYLEIGSFKGGSLNAAYEGTQQMQNNVDFIAIDQHFANTFFDKTKHIPNLNTIPLFSDEVHDSINNNSVDLLFIDGDHRYYQVKRDLENYWPKIEASGILLGHDYLTEGKYFGVRRAADEFFGNQVISLNPSNCYMVRK